MGAWGTRIYEDDTALDIRSDFLAQLKMGHSVEMNEATILHEYIENEDEIDDVVWLALCCVELETGTLTDETKQKALEIIGSDRQYLHWLDEAGAQDAGLRKRELTLIKKYIDNYDGKPVKRKSWVELQRTDKAESGAKEEEEPEKLDDASWHANDGPEDVDDETFFAMTGAHIYCFVYWLITRDYFAFPYDDITKQIAQVKAGKLPIEKFFDDHMDQKFYSDQVIPAIRPFVLVYYNGEYPGDYEEVLCQDKKLYSFIPTTADKQTMARKIDERLKEYKKNPIAPQSQQSELLSKHLDIFTRIVGIVITLLLIGGAGLIIYWVTKLLSQIRW